INATQALVNASKLAGVYWRLFFRIGTFQWVTSEKNKKSDPHLSLCSGRLSALSSFDLLGRDARQAGNASDDLETVGFHSGFINIMSESPRSPRRRPFRLWTVGAALIYGAGR